MRFRFAPSSQFLFTTSFCTLLLACGAAAPVEPTVAKPAPAQTPPSSEEPEPSSEPPAPPQEPAAAAPMVRLQWFADEGLTAVTHDPDGSGALRYISLKTQKARKLPPLDVTPELAGRPTDEGEMAEREFLSSDGKKELLSFAYGSQLAVRALDGEKALGQLRLGGQGCVHCGTHQQLYPSPDLKQLVLATASAQQDEDGRSAPALLSFERIAVENGFKKSTFYKTTGNLPAHLVFADENRSIAFTGNAQHYREIAYLKNGKLVALWEQEHEPMAMGFLSESGTAPSHLLLQYPLDLFPDTTFKLLDLKSGKTENFPQAATQGLLEDGASVSQLCVQVPGLALWLIGDDRGTYNIWDPEQAKLVGVLKLSADGSFKLKSEIADELTAQLRLN